MIQKLKLLILSLSSVLLFSAPLAVPAAVSADTIQSGLCHGAQTLDVTPNTTEVCTEQGGASGFSDLLKRIINIISVIVGVIAVIMIIIGGFRYITSGGSSEKVTAAKNTLLYAIIGLVIVALAQVIVRFVLTKTTSAT